jgi:Tol biopolymer transport system component
MGRRHARSWRIAAVLTMGAAASSCVLTTDLSGFSEQPRDPRGDGSPVDSSFPDTTSPNGPNGPAGDAGPSPCDLTAPFQRPNPITSLNTNENDELWPRLTPDELTMVLATRRLPSPFGIYVARRSVTDAGWSPPDYIATVAASPVAFDTDPMLSADGRALYFASDRRGTHDLFVSTRSGATFGPPEPITRLNESTVAEFQPFLTFDGTELWFSREISGKARIMRAPVVDGGFGDPSIVPELMSGGNDWLPTLSADGLTIYFSSTRAGGSGDYDIWVAKRGSTTGTFGEPRPVAELNGPFRDAPGYVSTDGCRLYFDARRVEGGTTDLYLAEKPPR